MLTSSLPLLGVVTDPCDKKSQSNLVRGRVAGMVFTARRLAKRGICRRRVSVCVCVCHTPVLYQNG